MKNYERPGKWKRYIFPVLLLAVVCIGSVELLVCAWRAPDVYSAITAPVREAARRAGELGEAAWDRLGQRFDSAVAEGVYQVQVGLRRLDDYLTREPESDPEPGPELDGEVQLVDSEEVEPPPRAQADYSVTALAIRGGKQYLTGGSRELVYYDQTASTWADEPYGSDTIGRYGCGPTAMAMVVSTLTETSVDPARMAQHCVDQGYWARKRGSYWSIVPGVAEDFGLTCTSLPPEETDSDTIIQCLATGQLLVALVGPGHFTNGGHFIVLRGVTLDGSILVGDPASSERSLTAWDRELILEALSSTRNSGGPLWAISPSFLP